MLSNDLPLIVVVWCYHSSKNISNS